MKRCPECGRDYNDDSLSFCLDDGSELLFGPASLGEPRTAILESSSEAPTQSLSQRGPTRRRVWLAALIALVAISGVAAYLGFRRTSRPELEGSFRSVGSPAYDYYLRGKLDSGSENQERNANAITVLEDVVKADPTFAPAYAELARAYGLKANYFAPENEKAKLYQDAKVAVEKSLVLEPNLAEAHFVRGAVLWTPADRFPHEQAIVSLKKAIELDPNLDEAHHQLGVIYYHIGLLDKGEDELKKTLQINPGNTLARMRIGIIAIYRSDYEKALNILKTVPPETSMQIADRVKATALFELGRDDEAAQVVDEFLAKYSDEGGNVTSVKAMLLAKAGKADEAEKMVQRAIEIGQSYQHFHHTTYNIASTYALLGKPAEAVRWLQVTADDGFPCYPLFENDANLNSLRHDERFIALMVGMKRQWEHYKSDL